jgi:predicted small metal-binding protein
MQGFAADLQQVCGCSWAATGSTQDELVGKVKQHAKTTHGMNEVSAEIGQKLERAIRPTM